ncbi:hypothetical protein WSM22_11880 [Cytophagales bacterium WSM2-2]|nr:hypothetical protein WSM22_11880 [Cytophagales bacterium WSM2-2]
MPPRRQYIKEAKRQIIPKEILNTEWFLETYYEPFEKKSKPSDCNLTIRFLEKGRFTFTSKGHLFQGDNLWYIVRGSAIEVHTRPIDKFAWSFNCDPEPDHFSRMVSWSIKTFKIVDNKLILSSNNGTELVFKKL